MNNHAMKVLVERMAEYLSPASIRDYCNIVKPVVASAIDENGEEKFHRKWNEQYIDAPMVGKQRQPTSTCAGVSDIVLFASGQHRYFMRPWLAVASCGRARRWVWKLTNISPMIFARCTSCRRRNEGRFSPT